MVDYKQGHYIVILLATNVL